jgi:hypothetical protein
VCVTKFDNPEVFNFARRTGFVRYAEAGEPMRPEVADEDAERLFRKFCDSLRGGDADLMYSSIRKNFLPDRVRYFFTSAVGFYADRSGRIWPDDFVNVSSDPGNAKIRGKLNPVNVVEPVLWLGGAIMPDSGSPSAPLTTGGKLQPVSGFGKRHQPADTRRVIVRRETSRPEVQDSSGYGRSR